MSIVRLQAIEAARRFAMAQGGSAWDDASIEARIGTVDGRAAWIVRAADALDPAQPAWAQIDWKPVSYFVDAESGRVFGFASERCRTMLDRQAR